MALTSSDFTAPATENVKLKPSIYGTIIQIGADETPILSKIGTSNVTNPLTHSWLTDTLQEPKRNAHPEISGLTEDTRNTTQKTTNALQIFKTEAVVSDALLKAQQYGGNEMAYQITKRAKEHKLDIEYALLGLGRDANAKTSVFKGYVQSNTANNLIGEAAGIFFYLAKNDNAFANGRRGNILAFDDKGDWSGAATELTEYKLNTILQNIYNSGAKPKDVFLGANLKGAINAWASRILGNEKHYNQSIVTFDTDFGQVTFHLHRMLSDKYGLGDVLIAGDFDFIKHGLYIPTKISDVITDKTALSKRIYTQSTFEVRNADALAVGVGLKYTPADAVTATTKTTAKA